MLSAAPAVTGTSVPSGGQYPGRTPIGLINNNIHVTGAAGSPSIFTSSPVQVLRLPTQGAMVPLQPPPRRVAPAAPARGGPTAHEKFFGGQDWTMPETTTQELARFEILTMRQLQRALQHKIAQNSRTPAGFWNAFHKLDRRGTQQLNEQDLIAGVRGFNLVASDELVKQLLHALDSDHDGVLSMQEFVAGLQYNHQLQAEPSYNISSRRHFRNIDFHHPLHNMTHLSTYHQFDERPGLH